MISYSATFQPGRCESLKPGTPSLSQAVPLTDASVRILVLMSAGVRGQAQARPGRRPDSPGSRARSLRSLSGLTHWQAPSEWGKT